MHLLREITAEVPIDVAFSYVSHFENLFEWDDHVTYGHRYSLGDIGIGSSFYLGYSLLGQTQELRYEIVSYIPKEKITLSCTARHFTAIDTIYFSKVTEHKTKIIYEAEITLTNPSREIIFKPLMNKVADRIQIRLKEVLEQKEVKKEPLTLFNLPYRFTKAGFNESRKSFCGTLHLQKKILITGPTSGLGLASAKALAEKNCDLVLVGRNMQKLKELEHQLRTKGFCKSVWLYACDMENLADVKQAAQRICLEHKNLDAVINNAGALFDQAKEVDSIERTTIVDLIAPYIFSKTLKDALTNHKGCIINVTSGGMYAVKLNLDELKVAKAPFSGSRAYAMAKRAMVIYTKELNRLYDHEGVRVHTMHPGWAETPGVITSLPGFYKITKRFLRTPFQGADTMVYLALENPPHGGELWLDRSIQSPHLSEKTKESENDVMALMQFLNSFC